MSDGLGQLKTEGEHWKLALVSKQINLIEMESFKYFNSLPLFFFSVLHIGLQTVNIIMKISCKAQAKEKT